MKPSQAAPQPPLESKVSNLHSLCNQKMHKCATPRDARPRTASVRFVSKVKGSVRARNRAAILASAKALFARNPGASMEDVAAEAGVVRRTIYGHFPNRSELLKAIVRTETDDLADVLDEKELEARPAEEAVAMVLLRLWPAAARFWPLVSIGLKVLPQPADRSSFPFHRRFVGLLERGQGEGVFADHLPLEALVLVAEGISFALLDARSQKRWRGDERDAAVAVLIALGVTQVRAEATVARCTAGATS